MSNQIGNPPEAENPPPPRPSPPKPSNHELHSWICPICGRGLSPFTNSCPCFLKTR